MKSLLVPKEKEFPLQNKASQEEQKQSHFALKALRVYPKQKSNPLEMRGLYSVKRKSRYKNHNNCNANNKRENGNIGNEVLYSNADLWENMTDIYN